jgi:hypothetical protein
MLVVTVYLIAALEATALIIGIKHGGSTTLLEMVITVYLSQLYKLQP